MALFLLLQTANVSSASMLSCEYDIQHSQVSAPSSDTNLTGTIHGLRVHSDLQWKGFCCTQSVYFGKGQLTGEDTYDDDLVSEYSEVEGEFRCGPPMKYGDWLCVPYIGLGARMHQFKNRTFLDNALNFKYLYLPIGFCATRMLTARTLIEAEVQYDLQTYGKWKFEHDALGSGRHAMIRSFGLNFRLLCSYQIQPRIWLNLQGTTRVNRLKFRNHGQISFHSRKQCGYGLQTGLAYHF